MSRSFRAASGIPSELGSDAEGEAAMAPCRTAPRASKRTTPWAEAAPRGHVLTNSASDTPCPAPSTSALDRPSNGPHCRPASTELARGCSSGTASPCSDPSAPVGARALTDFASAELSPSASGVAGRLGSHAGHSSRLPAASPPHALVPAGTDRISPALAPGRFPAAVAVLGPGHSPCGLQELPEPLGLLETERGGRPAGHLLSHTAEEPDGNGGGGDGPGDEPPGWGLPGSSPGEIPALAPGRPPRVAHRHSDSDSHTTAAERARFAARSDAGGGRTKTMPPGTSPGVGGSEADGPRGQRSRDRALRNSDAGVYGEEDRLVSALLAGATPQRHSLLDSALHRRQRLAQASSSGGTRMQLDYVPQKSFSRRAPSVGFAAASRPPPAAGWLSTEPLRGDPSRSGGPQGPCAPTGA